MSKQYSAAQILAKVGAIRELQERISAHTLSPPARDLWASVLKREWSLFERMLSDRLGQDVSEGNS